jgi:branched-chain amino acid transport system permease protein
VTARAQPLLLAAAGAAILVGINAAAPRINPYLMQITAYIGINIILAVSLNLISGFTGQLNLGHAGFMAVGAYLSAGLTFYLGSGAQATLARAGIPASGAGNIVFLAALLLGGGAAALFGVLVGLPTLRLRGDYLAIATLGFGEIIRVIIVHLEAVGAARGFVGIPPHTSFLWIYAWVALTVIAVRNLMTSAHGRALASVREDEMAAQVMGVDTVRYKVAAFTIGAFFPGIAGGLFAHYPPWYLNPSMFWFLRSIEILLMTVLGGMGSISGSVAGATILTVLPEALRTLAGAAAVAYAVAWAALLRPCLGRRGLPRWLALGAMGLAGATVISVLTGAIELGTQTGATPTAWLGVAAMACGVAAILSRRPRSLRRTFAAAGAGVIFALLFLRPELLPAQAAAARDWLSSNVNQLRMVIYAVLLIALMLVRPQGLFGRAEITWRALRSVLPAGKRRALARA